MTATKIEWAQEVWNPVRGCSLVSAGCRSCYAMRQAHRFSGPGGRYEGLTRSTSAGPQWTGGIRLAPEALDAPLRWRKPRRVFVNSMSDLFHEDVPDHFIERVLSVAHRCPHHTFQVLTKRPERMRRFMSRPAREWTYSMLPVAPSWPLSNLWLGVSCEDQRAADERIPLLLDTPAAVRFISAEPLLGPVDLCRLQPSDPPTEIDALNGTHGVLRPHRGEGPRVDWVIVGGESGPKARPCDVAWIRSIVEQCGSAGVACFTKQLGARPMARDRWDCGEEAFAHLDAAGWEERTVVRVPLRDRKGGDPSEWPEDLRVRQFPGGEA